MDDQQKKTALICTLAALVLGAGGYFVLGGNGNASTDGGAVASATERVTRVALDDSAASSRRHVRTLPDIQKANRERAARNTGTVRNKGERLIRNGTKRPIKPRKRTTDPAA